MLHMHIVIDVGRGSMTVIGTKDNKWGMQRRMLSMYGSGDLQMESFLQHVSRS